MLSYKRSVRVAELLQQEISKIVQELRTPELGFVTVTGVKLTDDLQESRVFYSVIGSPEDVARSGELLQAMLPEIRHQVAMRVNMRRTPTIELVYDDTSEKANRIFEILNQIHDEEQEDQALKEKLVKNKFPHTKKTTERKRTTAGKTVAKKVSRSKAGKKPSK